MGLVTEVCLKNIQEELWQFPENTHINEERVYPPHSQKKKTQVAYSVLTLSPSKNRTACKKELALYKKKNWN
jgi:hypothetical protein